MKIGFFTDSYKPYMSGVVKSVESFTAELLRQGHQVYIFAPDYPEALKNDRIFRFKSVPALSNPGFRLAIPLSTRILAEVKKLNLDIIHTHSPFLMGWLGKTTARRLDLPLVFTYHTLYGEYAHYAPIGQELARKLAVKYSKEYCQACDLVITPSNYVKQMLQDYRITTPLQTIPTGVDLSLYQKRKGDRIRKKYKIKENERILLFVGRLSQEKNLEFLVRSFKWVAESLAGIKLLLVGEGPLRSRLESLQEELGLYHNLIFVGKQFPEEVIDFYLASDLFVFPSMTETQGLVTLEAMAGGLPVVAVNAAGTTVMVEDGLDGILVRNDEYLFARAVINLLTHEKRYHFFAKNALNKAETFSIQKMTNRLQACYKKLQSGNNGYNKNLA